MSTEYIHVDICDTDIYIAPILAVADSRREAERSAVHDLLREIFGHDVRLDHTPSGAPMLPNYDGQISISHSKDWAAVALSRTYVIGIDIEQMRDQLRRVASRFLSENELDVYGVDGALLLKAWTLKEALYKAALTEGVDLRHDIALPADPTEAVATVRGVAFGITTLRHTSRYAISLAYRLP